MATCCCLARLIKAFSNGTRNGSGYVDSIPLIGAPEFMTYSEDLNRVYLAYQNGLIRQIDLDAEQPAEVPFASLPQNPMGLQSAGEYLLPWTLRAPGCSLHVLARR